MDVQTAVKQVREKARKAASDMKEKAPNDMTREERSRIVKEINERLAKQNSKPPKKEKNMKTKGKKVETVPSSSIVRDSYKKAYLAENGDYICGDELSVALKAATTDERGFMDLEALRKVARENGFTMDAYMHLNRGQIRMNIGNKLRGKLQHGEVVKINGRKLKARK